MRCSTIPMPVPMVVNVTIGCVGIGTAAITGFTVPA